MHADSLTLTYSFSLTHMGRHTYTYLFNQTCRQVTGYPKEEDVKENKSTNTSHMYPFCSFLILSLLVSLSLSISNAAASLCHYNTFDLV